MSIAAIKSRKESIPLLAVAGIAFVLITLSAFLLGEFRLFPGWVLMWGTAVVVYATCKLLTWIRVSPSVPVSRSLVYLFCEPGLNAKRFLSSRSAVVPPERRDWIQAFLMTAVGLFCLLLAVNSLPAEAQRLSAPLGMIAIVLMLHFGLLDLLSLILRRVGFSSTALMNAPWCATGVADFWSCWNTGFRDLSREFIFHPLVRRKQAQLGLWATFLFSGLVHDLVISIPAQGGYGMPTLYFLIQALAISFERTSLGKALQLNQGWTGWVFTALTVLVPVPLLFHFPFQENIVLPMLHDLRALQ